MACTKTYYVSLVFLFSLFLATGQTLSYQNAFPNLSFNFPVEIQGSKDGSNRLFVVEQPGIIRVFPNNSSVGPSNVSTFLDISGTVAYSAGQEIGLLGMAFHPNFNTNGYVFVYYIDRPENYRINIVRYQVSSTNANILDPSTRTVIAQFTKNQGDSNHNGGKISFGPDGYLYASIGDGGGGGDPQGNAQNLNTIFGSLLRIDIDVDGSNPIETNPELPNGNYEIPSDNPRVGLSGLDELYAWGIRNTWKFSFDASGRLWGADVGQNEYEEINIIERGGNYGWNKFEATAAPSYGEATELATTPDRKPIFSYDHSAGDLSITGGYQYRGSLNNQALQNHYIYGDYVSGRVWALSYNASTGATNNTLLFKTEGEFVSSFGEDEQGELYFSGYGSAANLYTMVERSSRPENDTTNGVGEWEAISAGITGVVESVLEAPDQRIYVAGNFTRAGNEAVANIAVLNTNGAWQALGSGSNGTIFSLAISQTGNLFAAGDFSQIGGIDANNIAFWNGSNWSPLGEGTNGPISKISFNAQGDLFVGGVFTEANGVTVNNIARWKDTVWTGLTDASTGITGTNNEIRSLAFDENNLLYVGGNFDTAGGNAAARIARWNGTNWSSLNQGTSGFVQAISVTPNYIYAGGNFAMAGTTTVNRIARFNRNTGTWQNLDRGLSGNVNTIEILENYVYVGGMFETASQSNASNPTMNNVARWSDGAGWEALGQNVPVGVTTRVNSLQFVKNGTALFVGGNFTTAGNQNSNNIALWSPTSCPQDRITPEYRVNGVWQSGLNTLTVEEGDAVVLSILQNEMTFTITLPNETAVNNDFSLGNVTAAQAGTYIFTTAEGCSEAFTLIVKTAADADDDNDGVPNGSDNCPDTPANTAVDSNGCTADNAYTLSSQGTSCIGSDNGSIDIVASEAGSYLATLNNAVLQDSFTFTQSLTIPDLPVGLYDLCISSTAAPENSSCYKVAITEPAPLEVQMALNALTNSVTLTMKGAESYTIEINGEETSTGASEVTLPLSQDINLIKVSADKACLGTYEETIVLENTPLIYPNPISDVVTVDLSTLTGTWVEIALYSELGSLIEHHTHQREESSVTLNTTSLASGMYILRLTNSFMDKSFKIVKP